MSEAVNTPNRFWHIDYFSTSLEDLKARDKRDPYKVFDVIVANGRFSTFEIDDALAGPVTMLFRQKLLIDTDKSTYPWCYCKPTEEGLRWRKAADYSAKT